MIQRARFEEWISAPLERVFCFFSEPLNLPRLMPPELAAEVVRVDRVPPPAPEAAPSSTAAGVGTEIRLSVRLLPFVPFRTQWVARIVEFEPNRCFVDVQVKGPFRHWRHRHEFESNERGGDQGTVVRDELEYDVGFGSLGDAVARWLIAPKVQSTFAARQGRLEALLEQT
jgi:ligand-binding SRPBCC domain-containing protein